MSEAAPNQKAASRWLRWFPPAIFVAVFVSHAFYVRHVSRLPAAGWADTGIMDDGFWGFQPYLRAQDYFAGFSYALAATFGIWAITQFVRQRRAAMATGAVGSISLVAVLMAGGCFLIGCCGSPMLGVYLGIFGAKALGAGKPLMALVTLLSTGCGYYCLSPRFTRRRFAANIYRCECAEQTAHVSAPEPGSERLTR